MGSDQTAGVALRESEAVGGIILPALLALAVGAYKMATQPWPTTNGQLLLVLGGLALVGGALASLRPWLAWFAAPLGLYTFTIIGCFAFAMAISEESGWQVASTAFFWIVFGWYTMARMGSLRRHHKLKRAA